MPILAAAGNLATALILFGADVSVSITSYIAYKLIDLIDFVCGSGKNTARKKVPWHAPRCTTEPVLATSGPLASEGYGELDEAATLAKSTFPIKPDTLVARAKEILAAEFGTRASDDASAYLADDFQFVAPIIGPLSRAEFVRAFGSFKLKDAVPDIRDNAWFRVDPLEPNRVWFFSRPTGTHTGPLRFGGTTIAPTGKRIEAAPQASSMLFNEDGRAYTLTVGYTIDKRVGNSNGLGALLGILYAVGKPVPVPEGQRLYTPSLRFEMLERMGKMVESLGYDPNTRQPLPREV